MLKEIAPHVGLRASLTALFVSALLAASAVATLDASAQGGGHTLEGDLKVDESKVEGQKPLSFDITLYAEAGTIVGRQSVPNGGRYRFLDLPNGNYDLAVEVEGAEVTRIRVRVFSNFKTDFHQDIELQWRARASAPKPGNVSAADFYKRTSANQKLYDRAEEAMTAKKYPDAAALFQQLVTADAHDYQAWTELGTAYLLEDNAAESEKSYLRAVEVRPSFTLAYLALGQLRMGQKNYDGAIEILTRAAALQPPSADADMMLGECYLQVRKGSKAVALLQEAARLGKPEALLRLALLYDRAGMKAKAADVYEQFLAARPDYPDRKNLEQYIKENKKQ